MPFRPDFAISADNARETLFQIECCHASQFLDWLPWIDDKVDLAGKSKEERIAYVRAQLDGQTGDMDDTVRHRLTEQYGEAFARSVHFAESWQVSEYGAPVSQELAALLTEKTEEEK